MATQQDIAKQAGVSVAAVSAAFRRPKQISQSTREKILKIAREQGYLIKSSPRRQIGLAFINFKNHYFGEFYNEVIYGILQRLAELGWGVHIHEAIPENYADVSELAGFLVVGKSSEPMIPELLRLKMPHVLVDCTHRGLTSSRIYFDNLPGVKQLAEYVVQGGHRHLAIMTGEKDPDDITWRRFQQGVEEVMETHKLPVRSGHLQIVNADYGDVQTVELAIRRVLSPRSKASCLMCTNDLLAYTVYRILKKYRLKIPNDISVTGFDGICVPRFLDNPIPELTTVYGDRIEMGRRAVDLLGEVLQRPEKVPREILLETELRIGGSVKRIPVKRKN